MNEPRNDKLRTVLLKVFELEQRRGHLKWRVSELARSCSVSRPLVYYHLGRSKPEILESAVDMVWTELFALDPHRAEMVRKGRLRDSVLHSRAMVLQNPDLIGFYLRWRATPGPLRSKFLEFERRYQQRLRNLFPDLSRSERFALQAVLHGLMTSPFADVPSVDEALSWLPAKVYRAK